MPSILVTQSRKDVNNRISELAEMYQQDLPSPGCLKIELDCWLLKWQQQMEDHGRGSLPTTPVLTLSYATSNYPNIRVLVTICVLCQSPLALLGDPSVGLNGEKQQLGPP